VYRQVGQNKDDEITTTKMRHSCEQYDNEFEIGRISEMKMQRRYQKKEFKRGMSAKAKVGSGKK
jgi:hypothetical protein